MNLEVWTQDEAGPFQTIPMPGQSWREGLSAQCQAHEYTRGGTAKLLTLFCPSTGEVRARGVTTCPNTILHSWFRIELTEVIARLPPAQLTASAVTRERWREWQAGLQLPITLPAQLPPLPILLVLDNLAGHKTPELVLWFFAHGIMPLDTPLSGSWLNMCESVQRIIKRRALECQHRQTTAEIIRLLEAAVKGWNLSPTPFEWGGRRAARRQRSRERAAQRVGGSGAVIGRRVRNQQSLWI
jgi:hypothetical protein